MATDERRDSAIFRHRDGFRTPGLGFGVDHPIYRRVDDIEQIRRVVMGCRLTAALDAMGERWSFLILRGAFNGLNHFEQFQATLGIARNILANRLARLVAHGILERCPCADDRRKVEYRLTEKGAALLPTLVAIRQWGERWAGEKPCNSHLVDTRDGLPVAPMTVRAADGRTLQMGDMRWDVAADDAGCTDAQPENAPHHRIAAE
jgi:DNA-binding HxlR family transcriptional regulator